MEHSKKKIDQNIAATAVSAEEKTIDYVKYIREKVGHSEIILNYAGCIVLNGQKEILLQKRRDCNEWGFLGGVVELGESLEEAAVREVYEESGLRAKVDSLFGVYSKYFNEYPNSDKVQTILTMFLAHIVGGEMSEQNNETISLRYFPLDKAPELFIDQHRDILADLIDDRKNVYR